MRFNKLAASSAFIFAVCALQPAFAQDRAEVSQTVNSFVARQCPITPAHALDREIAETREIVPFLGAILAGVAGAVVQQGLTAAGDALEAASKEQGIVAEATTTFPISRVVLADDTSPLARVEPLPNCLILFSAGTDPIEQLPSDPSIVALGNTAAMAGLSVPVLDKNSSTALLTVLRDRGMTTIPAQYVELQILDSREGLRLRPTLVWYRKPLAKAPRGAADAELHVMLATPGASTGVGDIGTIFGGARMKLPKIQPGTLLDWTQLRPAASVMLPLRPSIGAVDSRMEATNSVYTGRATKKKEQRSALRAKDAAVRKHNAKPTADTAEAVLTTTEAYNDAVAETNLAEQNLTGLKEMNVGWTNAKLRLVVIKDANKFGLALAKLLKGQAEATGKAVTTELTPSPDWSAANTTYLSAKTELDAKQREYDAALATGDSAAIAKLGDEVLVKKAKLNEAAVAIKRPIPYPTLLN